MQEQLLLPGRPPLIVLGHSIGSRLSLEPRHAALSADGVHFWGRTSTSGAQQILIVTPIAGAYMAIKAVDQIESGLSMPDSPPIQKVSSLIRTYMRYAVLMPS